MNEPDYARDLDRDASGAIIAQQVVTWIAATAGEKGILLVFDYIPSQTDSPEDTELVAHRVQLGLTPSQAQALSDLLAVWA